MPASYMIDVQHRVVFSRFWGVVNGAELKSHARALAQDPSFEPTFRQLTNLDRVRGFVGSDVEIMEAAALNPFAKNARRVALVSNVVALDIVRAYQRAAGAEQTLLITHGFRDAIAWLGVDATMSWPVRSADWASEHTLREK